jgi:hypothetical protein
MAIQTKFSSIPPNEDLSMVVRRINDNLSLVMEAIRDIDRRVDALADEVAKLGPAKGIGDDEPAA